MCTYHRFHPFSEHARVVNGDLDLAVQNVGRFHVHHPTRVVVRLECDDTQVVIRMTYTAARTTEDDRRQLPVMALMTILARHQN